MSLFLGCGVKGHPPQAQLVHEPLYPSPTFLFSSADGVGSREEEHLGFAIRTTEPQDQTADLEEDIPTTCSCLSAGPVRTPPKN